MTMIVVVHLKPEWYEKLIAHARAGSKAEACLNSAVYQISHRGESEYVLRCDEHTISILAALADIACPETIPAMLKSYREARAAG
jgi:hypothetical protein